MRRTVPLVIAFTVGMLLLTQYFVPGLHDFYEVALEWSPIIGGVTAFLGIISFLQHHYRKTRKKAPDWRFSMAALAAFTVMVLAGFWGEIFEFKSPEDPPSWREVSFEDHPNDAGGLIDIRWKVDNRVGEIREFEVHRRETTSDSDPFVLITKIQGSEHAIGAPRENHEENGDKLPSFVENGKFDAGGLEGWTLDTPSGGSVAIEFNEYRGTFAVLTAGSSITSPPYSLTQAERHRLSAIARNADAGASLLTTVYAEGQEGSPLYTFDSRASMEAGGLDRSGEWVQVVKNGLSTDLLAPLGAGDVEYRVKFQAAGGTMHLDDIAIRPVIVEFLIETSDAAVFNNDAHFPHYGEGKSLLASFNPTFDVTLAKWTYDPPCLSEEDKKSRRVEREDKEKKHCALVPAGSSLLSSRMERPGDPLGHRFNYRLRSWGKGDGCPLRADIVAFTPDSEEVLGSIEWEADEDWEVKELLVQTPENATAFQIRYIATGGSGSARVDEMFFMPVKMKPEVGVDYVYKVVALGADGNALAEVVSPAFAGEFESIGSLNHPYGVYNWLFYNVLVPMEATMFALLAFYIASAAFRAFRARSLEATLLLVAAIFVMIGRVPIGEEIWRPLGDFADWIMQYPNGGAKRAIMMGVGLGMAATSLKLMLGIERTYLGKG